MIHADITDKIIRAFYKVNNTLGFGFLEKVYENALLIELLERGLKALNQFPIQVQYKGQNVGEYFADIVVNDQIIIELKAVDTLQKIHEAQLLNYLKATGYKIGLLINLIKNLFLIFLRNNIFSCYNTLKFNYHVIRFNRYCWHRKS